MSARCILGCPPKTRAKHVHRFPNPKKYPNQHEAWWKVVPEHKKENYEYNKIFRICDKHFLKKDKYNKGLLNRIAIPTLCLPGQPSTHNNCDCDWKFAGADSPFSTNNVEVIINTVEDEHDYTTQIKVRKKKKKRKKITGRRKYTSLLEKEHDHHSKPQEKDKAIDYVHESGNATSTCIKLLGRYDDFEKIVANGLTPTEIEDATNVTYTLEETLSKTVSDADVVKVETKYTKTLNQTDQNRRTKNANSIRNANISKLLHENTETSTISKICIPDTNSNELCISDNDFPNNAISRRTLVPQPVLSNADIADLETENTSIAKANTNTLRTPTEIEDATNITYTLEEILNNVSDKPQPLLSDDDADKVETEQTKPQTQSEQNRKTKKEKMKKSNCKVYNMGFIGNTSEHNYSKTSTISNSNRQNNVTGQVQPLVSDAAVTENTNCAKTIQNTKTLHNIQNNNIVFSVLKSGNLLFFNSFRNANISKLMQENTETSTISKICIPDTNSDELCISDNDFPNNAIGRRTLVPQPVLSNADIADLETENTSNAEINFDRLCISNDLQSNVTGQVHPLVSDAIVTENTSSAKAIQNTKTLHNIQNNGLCKQSLTGAHFATLESRCNIFNDNLLLKTECNYVLDNSLLKPGCNVLNANSIRNANISKLLQENTETSTMPKICMPDTNSDELCISDNDIPIKEFKIYKIPIGRRTEVPQPVVSNADIADLETENTSIAKANTNVLIPVRIYNEGNSTSGSCPGSPKRAKLDISELDEYRIVGSTTIVSGLFVPDEIQPSEDPLAICSPDIGVNDSVGLNEDSMVSVEDSMGSVEDSMGTVEYSMGTVEDSMGSVEDSMGTVEDSMGTVEESMGSVEDSMGTVVDRMGTVEDSMETVEDSMGTVEDMGSVEDNISCVEDNTRIDKDSSHPVDNIEFHNKDIMVYCADEAENELDASMHNIHEDELEIAFAVNFIFKQGKTAEQAFEEIVSTYGPGKISLKETECWYREFELENDVIRIISSGGPVYK